MIYFVRHGETVANEQNYFAGMMDVPLTELGCKQAEKAGQQLLQERLSFDEVHVSTLSRSKDTAKIIVEKAELGRVKTRIFKELVERDFGSFVSENKNLLRRSYGYHSFEDKLHSPWDTPDYGERLNTMFVRLKEYYNNILKPLADQGKNILVVAHKYVIELFAMLVADKQPEDYFDLRLPNSKPMNEDELKTYFTSQSKILKEVSDRTIFSSSKLILGGAIAGVFGKLIYSVEVNQTIFLWFMGICLTISSFFVLLSINTKIINESFSIKKIPYNAWMFRVLFALLAMLAVDSISAHPGIFLLIMPPALTVPVISILLGGDLYMAIRKTIFISVCSPLLVAFVLLSTGNNLDALIPFASIFTGAMLLPGLLAQAFRKKEPIQAGKMAERWKWTGVLSIAAMATACMYVYTPLNLGALLSGNSADSGAFFSQGFEIVILYLSLKCFALFNQDKTASWNVKTDIYLSHSTPNIFLWISLISIIGTSVFAPFWGCFMFFGGIFIDELIFVNIFKMSFRAKSSARQLLPVQSQHIVTM